VAVLGVGRGRSKRGRYRWSQAHTDSAMIVVQDPTVEKMLEMPLTQRDDEVQALAVDCSHYTFASGVSLG
jgi:hypothetical protein